ncbi:MAG: hypothetical protein L0Y71_07515, partial [Gemmataceae bacterium]|nr:hypothetical protein [Gemmataceae bacterium]
LWPGNTTDVTTLIPIVDRLWRRFKIRKVCIVADGKSVFFKDIGKEFLDQNGGLSGAIMPDYLHLSAKGYDIWGKAIKADIEKLVK